MEIAMTNSKQSGRRRWTEEELEYIRSLSRLTMPTGGHTTGSQTVTARENVLRQHEIDKYLVQAFWNTLRRDFMAWAWAGSCLSSACRTRHEATPWPLQARRQILL
jgi:hypothetical protein